MPSKQARIAFTMTVAAAVAGLAPAPAAHADGAYQYGGSYVAAVPPFTWTGFHFGGYIGAAFSEGKLTDNLTGANISSDHTGFVGGVQVGYNFQPAPWMNHLVLGVVADFDWTSLDASETVTIPGFGTIKGSADTPWAITLAGRVGVAYDRGLVFFKVGGGWVHTSASVRNLSTGAAASADETAGAWLLGGGVEYAITRHWISRIEYDFLGLSERTGTGPLGNIITLNRDVQTVKLGLSYKF
ncbi:MAG: outer membrane protein [Hyphomicrobiaceae bacterium]|jgi:opacity protein-like surface antigen